ncbi:TIGR02301 family protein [Robiginitomaculum antarcticum]|uniref:TIGR02301 family protein n=1 Tax=Robiginitomaculum antarcticum TaxID=437507 RepID=UPI000360AED8|nr:TIGR02301 family protein [Robiginitomaculum antarcticum]
MLDSKDDAGSETRYIKDMRLFRFILPALCVAGLTGPAYAQTETPRQPIDARIEADMVAMPNMVQALVKNLGQLHYLRTLCFGDTDQTWRNYAQRMMDIEAKGDSTKRSALVDAFNTGYYDQKDRFSQCSNAVSTDAAALAENGRHLANMLADPYRE